MSRWGERQSPPPLAPGQLNSVWSSQDGTSGASDPASNYRLQLNLVTRPRYLQRRATCADINLIMALATQLTLTNGGLLMSITVDRKVVLDLLGKARTGDDILSVLEMIVTTFTESTAPTPTLEEIEF